MKLFLGFLLATAVFGLVARRWDQRLVSVLLFVVVIGVAVGYLFFDQI